MSGVDVNVSSLVRAVTSGVTATPWGNATSDVRAVSGVGATLGVMVAAGLGPFRAFLRFLSVLLCLEVTEHG